MPTDVIMPALGMGQETGTLVRWLKAEGEAVAKGEPLMEVETDKALVEVEATAAGVLAHVRAAEGDVIPVGEVIAQILDTASDVPITRGPAAGDAAPAAPAASPRRTPASPRARRLAAESGLDVAAIHGTGPSGAVIAADIAATSAAARLPSPNVGGGVGGEGPSIALGAPGAPAPQVTSRAWQAMADRMAASWAAPHFYLVREVMASRLVEMRDRITPSVEQGHGVRPTYTDILLKIVAAGLSRHPRLNATWRGAELVENTGINVGIAVATADTLLVPVMSGVDALTVGQIAARRQALVQRATAGRLDPSDLVDGTFTLSNLGMFGVDSFNGIINPPQVALLAVGRIADRVVAVDGEPKVRPTMVLTLSCDHRAVDGARAAPFLEELATLIEEPWGLMA
jgi:pyruvate dehydrogenase E2 component (dihydrolipoamide acetyltransferase)